MASTLYTVRCCAYLHSDDRGLCGRRYVCGKKAFYAQTNACPECGSLKAQWVAPARNTKKKKKKDPDEQE